MCANIMFPTDTVGKVPVWADLIPLADSAASNAFKETTVTDLSTAVFWLNTTTDLTEWTNLYYTEARVSANTDVAANTSDRHSHSNKAILDATTASFTTADQSVIDWIIAASQKIYVDWTNWNDTTWDGSIALPYATIQHAIDVITDATATKQYLIDIMPWEYVESLTTKPYIHLNWVWVVVSGSTWPLLTLWAWVSYIFRITFNLTPTTTWQTIVSSSDASWDSELNFCTFNVTSSTNDITSRIVDISAWSITLTESIYNYTMLWTSANVNTHEIFKSSWTASINIFRNTVISVVEDENDIVKCFSDSWAWNFFSSSVVVQMVTSNASFAWTMIGFSFTWWWNVKILGLNNVFIIWAWSGTGLATEMDTWATQLAENFSSRFLVAWFTNNYYANIASWDILNSYFNTVTAADWSIINWTINKLDWDNDGNFTVNTDIIDENTFLSWSTNDSLNDLFNIWFNAGWVSGWAITDNLDGTIDVAAWTWIIRTSNDEQSPVKMFDWAASAWISLTTGDNYIYIDYNTWTPNIQVTTTWSDVIDNENDKFELYEVYKEDATTLHISDHKQRAKNVPWRLQQYLYSKSIIERGSAEWGLILWETWTRNVTMSQGKIWIKLNPLTLWPIDTSWVDTFDRYYWCAATCTKTTGNTQWDNTQYDNAWTLTTFTNGRYGFQDFYVDADNEILSVYSPAQYNSQAESENANIATPPGRTEAHSLYIGRIVFQEWDSTALSILSPFTWQELSSTPVTDHGALSWLWDDDHTQYSLLAWRSGWQTLNGSTDSWENLTLSSTSNATKWWILIDDTYVELDEITTPANPAADKGRMYVKDDTWTTKLYFRDSAGTETDLLAWWGWTDPDAIHDNVASEISAITEKVTPVSWDFLLIEDSADTNNKKRIQVWNLPTAWGWEANTSSNWGTGWVWIVLPKSWIDLPFKSINATSSKILVTDDAINNNVDIDVDEAELTLSNLWWAVTDAQVPNDITLDNITQITNRSHTWLSDIWTNTHSEIDSHISSTSNPHTVTATQVGLWNVDDTSDATKNAATVTLTNKTLDLTDNTLTGSTAEFNSALTDWNFATQAWTETLTNKTMTGTNNTLTASLLKSATTEVDTSAATAPTTWQVLTATSWTAATWQTPSWGWGWMSEIFNVYNNTDWTYSAWVNTAVPWVTAIINENSNFSLTNNEFVAPSDWDYIFDLNIYTESNEQYTILWLYDWTNTLYTWQSLSTTSTWTQSQSARIFTKMTLSTWDKVRVRVTFAWASNLAGTSNFTWYKIS